MIDSSLDADLRDLRARIQAQKSDRSRLTRISRVLSLALIVVLVGFLASLYGKVTDMYAPERFEQPIQDEARYLLPRLEPELRTLWEEAAPVYGELALTKFEQALPAFQENAQEELRALRINLTTDAEDRIHAALTRISDKHRTQLAERFPRLSTPEGADELGRVWLDTMRTDFEQIVLHFHDRYSGQLGEMAAALDQFRPNEFENMSEEELTRQFVHLWLIKVDRWVLRADARGGSTDHDQ